MPTLVLAAVYHLKHVHIARINVRLLDAFGKKLVGLPYLTAVKAGIQLTTQACPETGCSVTGFGGNRSKTML